MRERWFGASVMFRWTGAALACGVMAFPLMVRAIRLSIEAVDRRLEAAAGTLGASPAWVFLTVTLPLILPGVVAGMILTFAKAMGEFGATITFVSNIPGETQTLPSAIYTFTQVPGGGAGALRLTLVSIVIAMAALIARHGGDEQHDQHERQRLADVRQTLRLRRQESGDEQQAVAGQEEPDQQPRLGEHDRGDEPQPALLDDRLRVEPARQQREQ